ARPIGCALPIEFHPHPAVVGDGNPRPAVQDGFADNRYGARVVYVCTEISAVIDAAEHPFRIWHQPEQSEAGAVGWRSMNGKPAQSPFFDPHSTLQGHCMADA